MAVVPATFSTLPLLLGSLSPEQVTLLAGILGVPALLFFILCPFLLVRSFIRSSRLSCGSGDNDVQ